MCFLRLLPCVTLCYLPPLLPYSYPIISPTHYIVLSHVTISPMLVYSNPITTPHCYTVTMHYTALTHCVTLCYSLLPCIMLAYPMLSCYDAQAGIKSRSLRSFKDLVM